MRKLTLLVEILFYVVFIAFAIAGYKYDQILWLIFGVFGTISMVYVTLL